MQIEIESLADLDRRIKGGEGLRGCVVQGLDLRSQTAALRSTSGAGAVFLGCTLDPEAAERLRSHGALVFPPFEGRPYHAYRPSLYTPEELLDGYERGRPRSFFESSRDAKIYHHYREARAHGGTSIMESLAQRLHDFSIDDAKHDLLRADRRAVAIMGGHAMRRDDPAFAAVTSIAQRLTRAGYFLISGGGPGAMEATNLGAWLGGRDDDAVPAAVAMLEGAPIFRDAGWIESALEAKAAFPDGRASLGIPTRFYGHEPSNLFATHIAKYFSNSLREDGLLTIATHGVIFAPGSAGTVQEVFMDAAQNHYGSGPAISPMVFFGGRYWREEKPVAPLLSALCRGRVYEQQIAYVETPQQVVEFIESHPPIFTSGSAPEA